jgi:hypothetical protein
MRHFSVVRCHQGLSKLREKSVLGFKRSKDRLNLSLRDNVADSFKLKPMFIGHSENHTVLMNYTKLTLWSISGKTKPE